MIALSACSCGAAPAADRADVVATAAVSFAPGPRGTPGAESAREPARPAASASLDDAARASSGAAGSARCLTDSDCGYDPAGDRCGTDPRYNRQPPIVDQGIVCYCDEPGQACAILRVPPVPCEGDADCAVSRSPRPHPVRADRDNPRERGRPCRDLTLSTTCEQTNICTLHRHECSGR
jgi:hypothetical protein